MKIALVHSFYSSRNPSGENSAVNQQVVALESAGHEVALFSARTDELESNVAYPLVSAVRVATGRGRGPALDVFNPDVVHVHNLFPNYGTSWLGINKYPTVATMHNYRPMCAAGTLFRSGQVCTLCPDLGSSLPGLRHGCYKNKVSTLPLTIRPSFGKDAVLRNVERIIVLTEDMRERYLRLGLPEHKLSVVPNFVPDSLDVGVGSGGASWIYVGRFSEEKGILPLAQAWPHGKKLILVGSGELEEQLRAIKNPWVEVAGSLSRSEVVTRLQTSVGLVFPSKWFEGLPMVYIEALSVGLPVLAWSPSVVRQLVSVQGTGRVADGFALSEVLSEAERSFGRLRAHCRSVFEFNYTERAVVGKLERVYKEAITSFGARDDTRPTID